MSYGYQGPPLRGPPPTSFGMPPGTPSRLYPTEIPNPMESAHSPPTSFGMPEPECPMRSDPPQAIPYPSHPLPSPFTPVPSPSPGSFTRHPSPYPQQLPGSPSGHQQPCPYPRQLPGFKSGPQQPCPYPHQFPEFPCELQQSSPYPQSIQSSPYPRLPGDSPYPRLPGDSPYGESTASFSNKRSNRSPPNPLLNRTPPYPRPTEDHPHPESTECSPYPTAPGYPGTNQPLVPSTRASHRPSASSSALPGDMRSIPSANDPEKRSPYPGRYPGQGPESQFQAMHDKIDRAMKLRTAPSGPRNTTRVAPKLSPTVVPYQDFDPRTDAEVLRKAMKGFGTDEKAIINVLANRTNVQRLEIAHQFKTLYGKDMNKDLKSELSGNFEALVMALINPLPQYYAKELHDAMSGIGTDECVLIEVMCAMSNYEIRVIRRAYETMYGRRLEDDLRDDTSGNFKRLMVSLSCGNRDESFEVNPSAAMADARKLLQAGELQFGTDESAFNEVLVQRNIPQLKQIFLEYQNITGHTIADAIEKEFSGDIKKGLTAIVKCVVNRAGFFAEQLYKSMKGMGTDDRRLIRLVVTRCEIDMGEIKQEFSRNYGQSLEDFISGDCSGHYKKCLLALIS